MGYSEKGTLGLKACIMKLDRTGKTHTLLAYLDYMMYIDVPNVIMGK